MWLADLWLKCVSVWSAVSLAFVDGVSRMDMLGLTWVALVLTVTAELTWNPSSKTLTYIHTHTCPSYTTSTHTFHKSCEPSPVIKRPSMRQSIRKQYHHRMAHHRFCNKIITKIMVSKEQRDERDNNHLLYSPAQLHLFFLFLVPTFACWPIKPVDLKRKRKKHLDFILMIQYVVGVEMWKVELA